MDGVAGSRISWWQEKALLNAHAMSQARPSARQTACAESQAVERIWELATFPGPSSGQQCPALQQPACSGPKDPGHGEDGAEGRMP